MMDWAAYHEIRGMLPPGFFRNLLVSALLWVGLIWWAFTASPALGAFLCGLILGVVSATWITVNIIIEKFRGM